jgi:hypothetical protein
MPGILEVSKGCWVHYKWLFLQSDFDFYKEKMLTMWKYRGIASINLVHVSYHLLLQQIGNKRIRFRKLWLSLHYAFLTMTKMRAKTPFKKKDMYGNQEIYVLTKFNQWKHSSIKMPILVLVVFWGQSHLMQKQSLQNQQPQQTIYFVRDKLLAKFLWPWNLRNNEKRLMGCWKVYVIPLVRQALFHLMMPHSNYKIRDTPP